jgi:hypothetical protein
MPAGITQLIDRQVTASMNAGTGDVLPAQSVSSGTGAAQYQGVVGSRIALDSQTIKSTASIGTLFGGIYQYVFMTYTTTQPIRGAAVFWDLSVGEAVYQVNGDAKPTAAIPTLVAGVALVTWVKNTYYWMQIAGRASCLFDSAALSSAVAGNPVSAKVSPTTPSTFDVGAAVVTATTPVTVMATIGVAETIPTVNTVSVVTMFSWMMKRF